MLFSILLIAVSLSLDAFGAGITYGMRKIRIPFFSKLIICFMSVLYSGLSISLGKAVNSLLPPQTAKIAGTLILGLMGLWIILQALFEKGEGNSKKSEPKEEKTLFRFAVKSLGITIQVIRNPAEGDIDRSGVIDKREALLLGLALSVDAIGAGIGSALAGLGSLWISVATGIFQMLLLSAGGHFGKKLGNSAKLNKRLLSFVPGVLLIAMAFIRIG